ncbi:MAG: hypothetical protein U9Q83_05400 [Bacteroidota bacterium]|nr:hypothetical protein [Bacteroidota bacterium]
MDVYCKKNDTQGRQKREKPETTKLKINQAQKISKRARRQRKKEARRKSKEEQVRQNLVGKLGDVYIWSGVDPESKYAFKDVIGTRERPFGLKLVELIRDMRSNPEAKLLIQNDGYDVYEGIIKECFAEEVYSYFNNRRNEKVPIDVKMPKNILHTVVNKKRNSQGEIEEVELKIVYGKPEDILSVLKKHNPTQGINTCYIERQNLNKRHFNARLRRKTLAFSKDYDCLNAQLNLQRMYANFCWKHRTLSKVNPTSPAMYINATDRIWELKELLFQKIY